MIDRMGTQVELERSLAELKMSQDAFIKQTAQLFQASKISALGEMAGGLSHEVNNSLMTIMGSVQQLERYFLRDGINRPEYNRKVSHSNEAIGKIKTVIDGLSIFSQQAEESEKLDRPLEEIIFRTLNFINEMIKVNEITMIVAPIPHVMVRCNPIQITQILFYLVKNAFDALGGVDDPMKRWIRLSFVVKDYDVEIRVMNGGPQISHEVRAKLFQPFFTTKEIGKGTGLSLSISKGIALAHKGDIYLDEGPDYTTFALIIPSSPLVTAHA
jgi:C4-dicarboxylate-specific signal transduction histidine kinase